jgi:hypothetical protein
MDHPSVFHAFTADEISDDDKVRMFVWLIASLRAREFEWFQYQDGVIDEAHFRAYAVAISINLGTERTRRFWEHTRFHFDPGFAAFVDDMLADAPLTTNFDLDAW